VGSSRYRIEDDYCAAAQLSLRARSTRGPPRQACRGNIGVLPIVVPVCCGANRVREESRAGVAGESCRDTACECKLIDLVSRSTLRYIDHTKIYTANFYSQTRRSGHTSASMISVQRGTLNPYSIP
jgi:hypothetical protein